MSGMGSMMGGTMAFGWTGALLIVVLIVAAVVLLAKDPGGSGSNAILTLLAIVGGVALVGAATMTLMHVGAMGP